MSLILISYLLIGFNTLNGTLRYVFFPPYPSTSSPRLIIIHTRFSKQGGGVHWKKFEEETDRLASMGITAAWLPPPTKGASTEGTGYDTYDRELLPRGVSSHSG